MLLPLLSTSQSSRSPFAVVLQLSLLLACFVTFAAAATWTKDDYEIFRLNDDLRAAEGSNTTFYSFLGVKPSASLAEINSAYKAKSKIWHPDKARSKWIARYNTPPKQNVKPGAKPTVHVQKDKKPSQSELKAFEKEANARYERLSVIASILRGEGRTRYDHFLHNGFPTWKGTGYYYQRYRPGLGTVLLGLFIFVGGGAHYGALYLSWKRQREFVQRYIKHARRMAWGDDSNIANIPGLGVAGNDSSGSGSRTPVDSEDSMQWNRKQKRAMEKEKRKDSKKPARPSRAAEIAKKEGISSPIEAELISGPIGAKKRTRAENGKILIVDSVGNVFLEEQTEEGELHEYLLDPEEIPKPRITDTFLIRAPLFLYNQSLGRLLNKQTPEETAWEANGAPLDETPEGAPIALETAISETPNAETRKRKSKAKARS